MGLLMHSRLSLVPSVIALAALLSCSDDTVAPPPKAPVGSLKPVTAPAPNTAVVTTEERALPSLYAKAISSSTGDAGAFFADLVPLLNADLVGFSSPGMAPAHGPSGVVAAHEKLFAAFDDRRMTLSRVWRTPAQQTFEWTLSATQAREWMGVPATHRPVSFKGLTLIWTKDDGSITDVHVYFDVALVKAELGAGPKGLVPPTLPTSPAAVDTFDQAIPPSAIETKNVAVVQAALDALENNNESKYLDAMADDIDLFTLEHADPAPGRADAKAYFRGMRRALGQLDTTVIGAWGVGNFAVVEYSIAGEQLAPILWLPAQRDKVVRFETVDICEIHDGKIHRIWRYDNPIQAAD